MLQLKNIVKTYVTGELRQDALKGVNIAFRENEFVSVLGQSGSGKTTLLNIIGGLDRYTSGDLVINGVSTKEYKDSDWDYYRNNSIGFVFQSYNLIPHQTVLSNVEMALTLSGMSKKERKQRAVAVLKKVGLGEHLHKKPNQMSGGQMQRVAIARALINNPDILLADEPTGALDSETSLQIMELLKEIAKDKLVIMVTHNPELAEAYSTRIVRLLDGGVVSDTNPYSEDEKVVEKKKHKKISMSFLTALSLSFNNLRTKKGRTVLTSFAGSIGIIGISLILALSSGMNAYISDIQKDTMASYPITISSETVDISSAMGMRGEIVGEQRGEKEAKEREGVFADYSDMEASEKLSSSIVENNLTEFKKYLDNPDSEINEYIGENGVVYTYDVDFSVYSKDEDGRLLDTDRDIGESISTWGGSGEQFGIFNQLKSSFNLGGGSSSGAQQFSELTPGADGSSVSKIVTDNYDVLYGELPTQYNEILLVLNEDNGISAETLCKLGIISEEQFKTAEQKIKSGEEADEILFSYEDITNRTLYLVAACDMYKKNENGTFTALEDTTLDEEALLQNAVELKITGIIRPKKDAENVSLSTSAVYTSRLTEYIINHTNESEVIVAQEASPDVNVLTGMKFEALDDESKAEDAKEYLGSLGISEKASFYKLMMYYASQEENGDTSANIGMGIDFSNEASLASALDMWLEGSPDTEVLLKIYDEYIAGSTSDDNLKVFGKVSFDAPSSISIYTDSFENKDKISECIENYNTTASEESKITYTDYVALLTSSITTIINGISYVLVAFVAISLIVSSIMIGIITHISVMERTKEIGILRALGASKHNISQVFNAETFIIGCLSGALGIGISLLLLIPINSIIERLSGIVELSAQLPLEYSALLIAISIIITVIGGLVPAKKAAKKDPVIALRTE